MTKRGNNLSFQFQQFMKFMQAEGETKPESRQQEAVLRQVKIAYSALSSQFVIILSLASFIASLGLMANSTVAIVGAMLIAPLMKPIVAFAYGLVAADRRLQSRALVTMCVGIMITILISGLAEQIIELRGLTAEILSRTRPSLIDLGVAVAAGIAAALASVRRDIADALPGVAIAVALVPPLCVSGITFSLGLWSIGVGSFLLFVVNLVAIILSAVIVFLLNGYGSLRNAKQGLGIVFVLLANLLWPLHNQLKQLRLDDLAQETVEQYIHEQYRINKVIHPNDLARFDTVLFPDHVFVFMEIAAPANGFSQQQLEKIHRQLSQAIELPVNLKVQFLLTDEIQLYSHLLPDGERPNYGEEDIVPRR